MPAASRPTVTAVKATAEDRPALVATLAAAFHDDPVAEWVFPDDDIRLRTLPRVYAVDVAQMHRDDCVWTTSDRDAAALWAPPGRWRHGVRDDLAMLRASWHWRLLPRLIGMARAFYESSGYTRSGRTTTCRTWALLRRRRAWDAARR